MSMTRVMLLYNAMISGGTPIHSCNCVWVWACNSLFLERPYVWAVDVTGCVDVCYGNGTVLQENVSGNVCHLAGARASL